MKNFNEYEQIALESKKLLFAMYVKKQNLEIEFQNKGGLNASIEVYKWRNSEDAKIENEFTNNVHRSLFLDAWNTGNFSNCDYHLCRF